MTNKSYKKIVKYVLLFAECAANFLIYAFITYSLCNVDVREMSQNKNGIDLSPYIGLLLTFLVSYSLLRFSVLYDREMREKFLSDGNGVYTLKEHFKFLFSFERTWILIAFSVLAFIILPTEIAVCSIYKLLIKKTTGILFGIAVSPLFALAVFIIYFIASRSAAHYWIEDSRQLKSEKFSYSLFSRIKVFFTLLFAYYLGGRLMIYLFYQISGFAILNSHMMISQKTVWAIGIIAFVFIVIPFIAKHIGALIKRRKFIKDLVRVCKENRCSLSEIRAPYLSLYKNMHGYDFDFELDGTKYACKMLSTRHRLRPITFFDGGMGAHEKIIRVKKTELFRIRRWFEYSFESDAKKIIVINPIPKILSVNDKGRVAAIDNGDSVDGYKIYSATALVNAIDRKTLGR